MRHSSRIASGAFTLFAVTATGIWSAAADPPTRPATTTATTTRLVGVQGHPVDLRPEWVDLVMHRVPDLVRQRMPKEAHPWFRIDPDPDGIEVNYSRDGDQTILLVFARGHGVHRAAGQLRRVAYRVTSEWRSPGRAGTGARWTHVRTESEWSVVDPPAVK